MQHGSFAAGIFFSVFAEYFLHKNKAPTLVRVSGLYVFLFYKIRYINQPGRVHRVIDVSTTRDSQRLAPVAVPAANFGTEGSLPRHGPLK